MLGRAHNVGEVKDHQRDLPQEPDHAVKTDALIEEFAGSIGDEVYPPGYLDDVRAGWR
jgi:hypothetical protein